MLRFVKHWYRVLMLVLVIIFTIVYPHPATPEMLVIVTSFVTFVLYKEFLILQRRFFEWRYSTVLSFKMKETTFFNRSDIHFFVGLPEAFNNERTESNPDKERIVGVANLHQSGLIYVAYAPMRHHNVIWAMGTKGHNHEIVSQGFLTNTGRYVNRTEASFIAQKANQVLRLSSGSNYRLFSEDLW